jgi:hypothetical protein
MTYRAGSRRRSGHCLREAETLALAARASRLAHQRACARHPDVSRSPPGAPLLPDGVAEFPRVGELLVARDLVVRDGPNVNESGIDRTGGACAAVPAAGHHPRVVQGRRPRGSVRTHSQRSPRGPDTRRRMAFLRTRPTRCRASSPRTLRRRLRARTRRRWPAPIRRLSDSQLPPIRLRSRSLILGSPHSVVKTPIRRRQCATAMREKREPLRRCARYRICLQAIARLLMATASRARSSRWSCSQRGAQPAVQ